MPDVPNEAAGQKNLQNSVNSYKQHENRIFKSRNSTKIPAFCHPLDFKVLYSLDLPFAPAADPELVCNSWQGEPFLSPQICTPLDVQFLT